MATAAIIKFGLDSNHLVPASAKIKSNLGVRSPFYQDLAPMYRILRSRIEGAASQTLFNEFSS